MTKPNDDETIRQIEARISELQHQVTSLVTAIGGSRNWTLSDNVALAVAQRRDSEALAGFTCPSCGWPQPAPETQT